MSLVLLFVASFVFSYADPGTWKEFMACIFGILVGVVFKELTK